MSDGLQAVTLYFRRDGSIDSVSFGGQSPVPVVENPDIGQYRLKTGVTLTCYQDRGNNVVALCYDCGGWTCCFVVPGLR